MALPSLTQLNDRKKEAEEKLRRLQLSYDHFMLEWSKIEKEETGLLQKLQTFVDQAKVHNILQQITKIKN